MTNQSKSSRYLLGIISVGLMAALVYVGNYIQFKIPNGVLVTRIHLGNSMCLLAGLLFGSRRGGLASGIGAALYDLFDPVYIVSAPYTFFSKFAMGWVAGKVRPRGEEKESIGGVILAAVLGQLTYIVLYLIKSFFTVLIVGGAVEAAWTATATNLLTSSINGLLAVIISVPLYFALKKALKMSGFSRLINEKPQSGGYFNPVTIALTVFAVAVTAIFGIRLSAQSKLDAAEEEKNAALQTQLDEYDQKLDYIAEQLGVDMSGFEIESAE